MPRIKTTSEKINGWKIVKKASDPAAYRAKVEIRNAILDVMGAANCHVFDAYAGEGGMWASSWQYAASYIGCDFEVFSRDERLAYVADNRRVMRNLDLHRFNVFDFDAHGSPWEVIYIMIKRRILSPGEKIGVVITEGQGMKFDMGGMSSALAKVAGVLQYGPGMGSQQQPIIDRAIMRVAQMMNGRIIRQWQTIGKKSSTVRYIGLVIEGRQENE